MIPENYLSALKIIVERLEGQGITWAVTGSLGFALQGVPVTPRDIDLQTDTGCAYEMESLFSEYLRRSVGPKITPVMRSVIGELEIEGVTVEIIGGVQKRERDGHYEPPVDVEKHLLVIEYEGLQVPVLDLEYERDAYLKLGRTETAALLADWLAKQQ